MKSKHHRRAPAVAAPQIHDRRAPGPGRPGPIARATISDRQAKALQYLAWSRGLLGKLSYELIHDVLGRGLTVRQAAAERGRASEWDVRHAGRTFRDALTLLAVTKR